MARFREILRDKNFFCFWMGQIVSQFGDRLNQMALIALVYKTAPGSAIQLAKLLSITIIPVFFIGPVAGVYVDRWNRKHIMVICDILRGMLVLLIPFVAVRLHLNVLAYLIVFLVFSVTRFFSTAKQSVIPEFVSNERLLLANSLSATTIMIAVIIGFGLGGIIVEMVGPTGGFYIDSATYFLSGILLSCIKLRKHYSHDLRERFKKGTLKKSILADIKEGARYISRNLDIRLVIRILFFLMAVLGATYVIMIVFVQEMLGSVTKDLAILLMSGGIGLFTGALAYGRLGKVFSKVKVIFSSSILSGVLLMVFVFFTKAYHSTFISGTIFVFLGMAISPIAISCNTLLYEATQVKMLGRVFSIVEVIMYLAFIIMMLITSFIAEFLDSSLILLFIGVTVTLIGVSFVAVNWIKKWMIIRKSGV